MMEKYEIKYGNKIISFFLIRKNVKNININIKPVGNVVVSANDDVSIDVIKKFVEQKSSWILKNISYFKDTQPEVIRKLEYISGESIRYLGKQYRLKIVKSDIEYVKFLRGYICIYVQNDKDIRLKEKLFNSWIEERTNIVFNEVLGNVYYLIGKYGVEKPKIRIRKMKTRWGSCLVKDNLIILNRNLIMAPKYCIEYVILHELIHFIYKNHDDRFYNLLFVLMPDWESRKKILDEEVVKNI